MNLRGKPLPSSCGIDVALGAKRAALLLVGVLMLVGCGGPARGDGGTGKGAGGGTGGSAGGGTGGGGTGGSAGGGGTGGSAGGGTGGGGTGGSVDGGPGLTVGGHTLVVRDAVLMQRTSGDAGPDEYLIWLTDQQGACDSATSALSITSGTALMLWLVPGDGGVFSSPLQGGFPIGSGAPHSGAMFTVTGEHCLNTLAASNAASGVVTVTSHQVGPGGRLQGSFDLTMNSMGERLMGTFDAPFCGDDALTFLSCD